MNRVPRLVLHTAIVLGILSIIIASFAIYRDVQYQMDQYRRGQLHPISPNLSACPLLTAHEVSQELEIQIVRTEAARPTSHQVVEDDCTYYSQYWDYLPPATVAGSIRLSLRLTIFKTISQARQTESFANANTPIQTIPVAGIGDSASLGFTGVLFHDLGHGGNTLRISVLKDNAIIYIAEDRALTEYIDTREKALYYAPPLESLAKLAVKRI